MKRKKIILVILGAGLVLAGAAAWYIYKEYYRMHRDTADLDPDYSVSATDLITEFEKNEQGSNQKYWDKVLRVGGMIKDIAKDDRGYYSLMLGDTSSLSSVQCNMDSLHSKDAGLMKKGSWASVKGICTGFNADELLGSDVVLIRCVLATKK